MWSQQHTVFCPATKESIWRLWSDVDAWNIWDATIEKSSLQGGFATGGVITLKPAGGPSMATTIVRCEPYYNFANEARLPFGRMAFIHELQKVANGVQVTHRIQIAGLLSPLYAQLIGKPAMIQLPAVMEQLVRRATMLDSVRLQ